MSVYNREEFLKEVLSRVRFAYDRSEIREELQDHLNEKVAWYMESGMTTDEAEAHAVSDMGDAAEIGTALNKEHSPLLGWIWRITNVLVRVLAALVIFLVLFPHGVRFVTSLFETPLINEIPEEQRVYHLQVDEEVVLDEDTIEITDLVYDHEGTLTVFFTVKRKNLLYNGWSFGSIGEFSDEKGEEYFDGSGRASSNHHYRSLENFPQDAEKLIIDYDGYGRAYHVEIQLPGGGVSE